MKKAQSQVKYINTDKHILRFARNDRTAARFFLLYCDLCELLLRFLKSVGLTFLFFSLSVSSSNI